MTTTAGNENYWTSALYNPKSLSAMYSSMPEVVELFRITFDRDGPSVDIMGRLDHFPETPPLKWVAAGSNCVLVTIRLDGIRDTTCGNWSTSNIGRFALLARGPGELDFSFTTNQGIALAGRAAVARVQEFSHYLEPAIAKSQE